jgi:hypothetical protein
MKVFIPEVGIKYTVLEDVDIVVNAVNNSKFVKSLIGNKLVKLYEKLYGKIEEPDTDLKISVLGGIYRKLNDYAQVKFNRGNIEPFMDGAKEFELIEPHLSEFGFSYNLMFADGVAVNSCNLNYTHTIKNGDIIEIVGYLPYNSRGVIIKYNNKHIIETYIRELNKFNLV